MSRSYKKTPICKDNKHTSKKNKKMANSKFRTIERNALATEDYESAPKKQMETTDQWDIHDYKMYDTEASVREYVRANNATFKNKYDEEKWVASWKKHYLRK